MKHRTEELLNFLLWSTEKLLRPSFRNISKSYEEWAYQNGLFRRMVSLQDQQLVEQHPTALNDRLYRLTVQGRLRALGGRDPQANWSREWDGRWRLVLFDVPRVQNTQRARLRRYLREQGFGCLQNSVWITPNSVEEERRILVGGKINVESLVLMDAQPCAGESDEEIVAGAWDFKTINQRYARYLEILNHRPEENLQTEAVANALLRWAADEHAAWLYAVTNDPLLPERILPSDYLGKRAWRRKMEVLRAAGKPLKTFEPW